MPSKRNRPGRRHGAKPQPSSPTGGWLRQHRAAAVIAVILLLSAGAWYWPAEADATAAAPPVPRARSDSSFLKMPEEYGSAAPEPDLAEPPPTRQQRLAALVEQVELADQTLCSYREGTLYPPQSRPIEEHPDQVYPNQPVVEQHAMRKEGGGKDDSVQIITSQSRVYLVAGEAVGFTIEALDNNGKPLPLFVTRAVARGLTFHGNRETSQLALPFADDGSGGDAAAGDNTFSALFAPHQTGFAGFDGTIRTEVRYSVGDRAGIVVFDVIYSPETPGTWTGPIRDAVEDGSLVFYLKANIWIAGRYVVSGRVDDANGKPFALATFNDLLQQGNNDVRLTVFGKLLHDEAPAMPLTLRDVDGYLLKEDADPDRLLMPRMEGAAHVSKGYPLKAFSGAEWHSEERERYLTELGKDLELAKQELVRFNPAQAKLPFPQSECSRERDARRDGGSL